MTARAALVCYRIAETGPITVEATYWDSVEQAREAEAVLAQPRCGAKCAGIHTAVSLAAEAKPRRKLSLIAGAPDGRRAGKREPYDGRTKASW